MMAGRRLRDAFGKMSFVALSGSSGADPPPVPRASARIAAGWKQAGNPGILQATVRSSTWLVPLACAVILAHGCFLDPQPEAPARSPEAGGPTAASATTGGSDGPVTPASNAATSSATTGGLNNSSGGFDPGPDQGEGGAAGAFGEAGAPGFGAGGAPNGE